MWSHDQFACSVIKHYVILPFFVNEEKLNNGYTITSLNLYIPKLLCICWHTRFSKSCREGLFSEASCRFLIILGAHAQRGLLYVCVCLSVKSHLTSVASVRPENTVTYQRATKVKICGFFAEAGHLETTHAHL